MPRPPILPLIDWKAVFNSGLDYEKWLKNGEHSDKDARMEEIRQSLNLEPHTRAYLAALPRPVRVVAIAEDWCGDVVRHAPMLQRLVDAAPNLEARFVTRAQHPEVFGRFLTNGGEAIPKFVFLSDKFVECGNWGPMPETCRELIARGKALGDVGKAREKVSALYNADPNGRVVIAELLRLIDIASTTEL